MGRASPSILAFAGAWWECHDMAPKEFLIGLAEATKRWGEGCYEAASRASLSDRRWAPALAW
jgi:hypothetical protein